MAESASLVQLGTPVLSGTLAQELKRRIPGFDYVYFTNSGAEGVETAIKFARRTTKRDGMLHASSAFHGLTTGALALNGAEVFRRDFGSLLPGNRKVKYNDLAALEEALATKDIAAFVVEPIQGKGVAIAEPGYLREAAQLCHKYGSLFVVDEIQSGMCRTGKFLAMEHDAEQGGEIDADIVVFSKALSGGYVPVGAVLYKKAVYNKVFSSLEDCVVHSSTFGQGDMAMVAGLAALTALDEENTGHNAQVMGDKLGHGLLAMKDRFQFIGDVRWRGLMIGIEFKTPKSLSLRTAWSSVHALSKDLFCQAITIPLLADHRILTQVSGHHTDIIKLIPPLVLNEDDVKWFLNAFEKVMVDLHKFPGPSWEALFRIGKNAVKRGNTGASAAAE
jgi:acetylornithine/succinyldiaminopimelate/putrescine aminotransferase